ncbi:MAG: hypothetical protein GXZ06_10635 [Tissierellia bacterium]|nr:hypothetical protein [Tissierellia bacterium]
MEHLYQKVSYLRGLAEGLEIDKNSKEGKLLLHIVEALEDFAYAINELYENYEDLERYVDYIDEDLTDVENELFDFDDHYEDDYEDDYDDYDDFEDEYGIYEENFEEDK